MREIKFRAWSKKDETMLSAEQVWGVLSMALELGGMGVLREQVELMQYTGLKDKNGKEIYEGDVVVCHEYKWVMEYDCPGETVEGVCYLGFGFPTRAYPEGAEVMGNIYENPELLNKELTS